MPATKKNGLHSNLKEIAGRPGLYTPLNVTRNPRKEKALWARILRDARKMNGGRLSERLIRS